MTTETLESRYGTAASRWAGVGPYYAMFPTSFAAKVVRDYTEPGDTVFDPFAGRATSLFAAASEGRFGLGVEINPVGWVYGKAKLQTATRKSVEKRLRWIGEKMSSYNAEAAALPEFFEWCFYPRVKEFLVAARDLLDWRRRKSDWTTMALLMVDLHGKRESALSNQMRQTKAMSPQYSINWWRERDFLPPELDPVEFMLKKVAWRYAKGRLTGSKSRVYLGDSRKQINVLARARTGGGAKLLFTSPPYQGVTNYFYDQWLRLWLLGGANQPQSSGEQCKQKFSNCREYVKMLHTVFLRSKPLLSRNSIVFVRTDTRKFTLEAIIEALEIAFPRKRLRSETHSKPEFTQTALFDSDADPKGEVDLVMW
jgi:DNA modification methylase